MPLILVADDQPSNLHALHQLLVDDCEASMTTSGAETPGFCSQQLPDLMPLGVLMPEMSGSDVFGRYRGEPGL